MLKNLENKQNRNAFFQCVVVKYFPNDTYIFGSGRTYGKIANEEIGDKSFGYDCIFLSSDLKKTFGEANDKGKNNVSHRKRAIVDLLEKENSLKKDIS